MSRERNFCFTDFVRDLKFYEKIDCKYIVIGDETCPETKKEHYQGYIYFASGKTESAVRKMFKPRHIVPCRGTSEENIKYCKKEGKIVLEKALPHLL